MAGGFLVYSASIADDRAPVARRSEPEPPSVLPAWSREEFRVSAQIATEASRVGKEVLSLPFSHKEVLPFTSPYLTEWELLGKRWRALPEAERLQYKIEKVAPSPLGSPTAASTTLSSSAEASVSLLLDLCPKPLSTLADSSDVSVEAELFVSEFLETALESSA